MKRIFIISLLFLFALTSCGKSKSTEKNNTKTVDLKELDAEVSDADAENEGSPDIVAASEENAEAKPEVSDEPVIAPPSESEAAMPSEAEDKVVPETAEAQSEVNAVDEPEKGADQFVIEEIEIDRPDNLPVRNLLSVSEFREVTGYTGFIVVRRVEGQIPDGLYNGFRYATKQSAELGFVLQVRKSPNSQAADSDFRNHYNGSFGGVLEKSGEDELFVSEHHGISELCFFAKNKSVVLKLSCTEKICSRHALRSLAMRIAPRIAP